MPPKNAKKTQEDAAEVEMEIIETLSPFEKQMIEKWDKMCGTLTDISKNVSKISKHLLTSKENTNVKEVVAGTSETYAEILKEMAGTLKYILKAKETTTTNQPLELQQTTQILIEQEVEKVKQTMIQTWNQKLQKRAAEFWQMIRNENTAKIYETWKNNSSPIIPRKMPMQPIKGEPEAQTKLREKQVLQNFQTEMELMKLRAESHEEKYKKIDSEMEEIISKKVNGQRKDHLKKLWKEECIREELRSRERWETSNIKWTDKYEAEFTKFYAEKNPFIWEEAFLPSKIRNSYRSKEFETNSEQLPNMASENKADVIITGVSKYAQAAHKPPITGNYQSTTPGTTFIGKKVRFNNPDTNKPKPNIPKILQQANIIRTQENHF